MNAALIAGCTAGGVVIGGVLDSVTGRIVRPVEPSGQGDPKETGGAGVTAEATVDLRVPPRLELVASAVLTGAFFALTAVRIGATPPLAAFCALFAGLVAASVVDAREGIVPRVIVFATLSALALGLLSASWADDRWRALGDAAIGGTAAFAVFFALWWFFPRGLGYGDVRLAGLIGTALGWLGFGELYVGFLAGFVAGTALGVLLMVTQGTGRKTRLPFGPPLALGAAFGVLWGHWAVHLWLSHT